MIVASYSEMKPFLPAIAMKGEPTIFDDALEMVQDALVEDIIGEDLETVLEARETGDQRLLKMCQRVIAVEAFLRSIPELDLVLTDSGFGVISNQDIAPASKERVANLTAGLQAKLDESKDRLVSFLMASEKYEDWRGTQQFARLADGLILTFAEFKDVAVYNPRTADLYPKTWTDFLKLNSSLNVALTSDVAAYISPEYASELLEKILDKETLLPSEKKVLHLVKVAIATIALGDRETGITQAIKAANFMKANPGDFPTFIGSDAASDLSNEHSDTPMFYMF